MRGQCCTITLLHMSSLNKTESTIFVSLMHSLLPIDLHSELILSLKSTKFVSMSTVCFCK